MQKYFLSFFEIEFLKNITILSIGSVVGQVILFLFTPLIARIYFPENFGSLSVFTSIIVILSIFSTGKFEHAVLVGKDLTESVQISFVGSILSAIFAFFCFIIMLLLFFLKVDFIFINDSLTYVILIPLVVMFSGINSCLIYLLLRHEKYSHQAFLNFLQPVVIITFNIGLGFSGFLENGLIISYTISTFFSFCVLVIMLKKEIYNGISDNLLKIKKLKNVFISYIDFPKYQLPAQGLLSFSQQAPPLLFAVFFPMTLVGFYSIANRILATPVNIVASSITSVFRNEVIKELEIKNDFSSLFLKTMTQLIILALPIFLVLFFFLPSIFNLVLGEQWGQASEIGRILCFMLFVEFVITPLTSSVLILKEKQKLNLIIQTIATFINILGILLGYIFFENIYYCLTFMVLASISTNITSLLICYKLSKGEIFKI